MNAARKVLIAKPEIPLQRVGRPSVFVMPEPERPRGRVEPLDAKPLPLHLVIAALLVGGAVTLTAVILNLAAKAAHIPVLR